LTNCVISVSILNILIIHCKSPHDFRFKMKKILLLVDGHAHCFQAYHAIHELTDPQGRMVNAVYGVINMYLRLLNRFKPTHTAIIFDSKGPTFRHDQYPEYKANRGPMDEDLASQIILLQDLLKTMSIFINSKTGYECDDIIGTLAVKADNEGFDEIIIVSEDKDFGQMIGNNIVQYKNRKDIILDSKKHEELIGVRPDQMIDYLALMGDSSDNIPGVPGIGPKTASSFLKQYGTADKLYSHINEIKGKKRDNLENNKEGFKLSRELVTICTDVPLDYKLDDLAIQEMNKVDVCEAFITFGFNQFIKRFNLDNVSSTTTNTSPRTHKKYDIIVDEKNANELVKKLKDFDLIAIDTETTGLDVNTANIVGISFSWAPDEAVYVAITYPEGGLSIKLAQKIFNPLLSDKKIRWVGHHIKFDAAILSNNGFTLSTNWEDTLLLTYMYDSSRRRLKLDHLIWDTFGEKMISIEDIIGKGKKAITMDLVPLEKIAEYAAEDADMTLKLFHHLMSKFTNNDKVLEKYYEQEIPLAQLLIRIERHGVKLDIDCLTVQSQKYEHDLELLESKIFKNVGHPFNISSPKQLGDVLFEELKLPVIKKTKTGYSTDSKVLDQLSAMHPVPEMVVEYRHLAKLKNTYIDALPKLVDKNNVLHTSFSQTTAITGRLSSTNPNLQNIPIRDSRGKAIREAFLPRKNDLLLSADYSQIELRLMAHFSADPELVKAFKEGLDIHRYVASKVNNVALEDVTAEQRSAAKAVNFGILYGQGAYGLAGQLKIEIKEAKTFIDNYFDKFSTVKGFIQNTIEEAKEKGYIETLGGHRRPMKELTSTNKGVQKMGERIAINTLMQGSAADLIKIAMLKTDSWLTANQPNTHMILQIHDELIFDLRSEDVRSLSSALTPLMTEGYMLNVPLEISISTGKNWRDVK